MQFESIEKQIFSGISDYFRLFQTFYHRCSHIPDHLCYKFPRAAECDCDPIGTEGNINLCDKETGQCICKENVDGDRCDQCKVSCIPQLNCYFHTSEPAISTQLLLLLVFWHPHGPHFIERRNSARMTTSMTTAEILLPDWL